MHVIKLDGYNATTENGEKLELGTFDSFGEEQLQIVKAPDWANLSVIATFNPPNRKPVQAVVDSVTGVIKVPKEAIMMRWMRERAQTRLRRRRMRRRLTALKIPPTKKTTPTKRRVKPMKDEMILSPEMDEELYNGKGEDENE